MGVDLRQLTTEELRALAMLLARARLSAEADPDENPHSSLSRAAQ
jgi:hypothetical protein